MRDGDKLLEDHELWNLWNFVKTLLSHVNALENIYPSISISMLLLIHHKHQLHQSRPNVPVPSAWFWPFLQLLNINLQFQTISTAPQHQPPVPDYFYSSSALTSIPVSSSSVKWYMPNLCSPALNQVDMFPRQNIPVSPASVSNDTGQILASQHPLQWIYSRPNVPASQTISTASPVLWSTFSSKIIWGQILNFLMR